MKRCLANLDDLSVAFLDGSGRSIAVACAEVVQLVLHDVVRLVSQ